MRQALEDQKMPMASADVTKIPQNYVALTDENALKQLNRTLICWMRMTMCRLFIQIWMNRQQAA